MATRLNGVKIEKSFIKITNYRKNKLIIIINYHLKGLLKVIIYIYSHIIHIKESEKVTFYIYIYIYI